MGFPGPDAPSNLPHLQVIFEATPEGFWLPEETWKIHEFTGAHLHHPLEIRYEVTMVVNAVVRPYFGGGWALRGWVP